MLAFKHLLLDAAKQSVKKIQSRERNILQGLYEAKHAYQSGNLDGLDLITLIARACQGDMGMLWRELADTFDSVDIDSINWDESITYVASVSLDDEPLQYESFDDFYAKECEPWLGPFDQFKQIVKRYRKGDITESDAAEEIRLSRKEQADKNRQAVQKAIDENPDATQQQIAEMVGLDQSQVSRIMRELCTNLEPKLLNVGEKHNGKGNNCNIKERGNNKQYLIARLTRDGFDDLADQVKAGTISARAAALQAGIVKPRQVKPIDAARKAFKALDNDYLADDFLVEIIDGMAGNRKMNLYEHLGRSLPDDFDYLRHAKEAAMNLDGAEIDDFKAWIAENL